MKLYKIAKSVKEFISQYKTEDPFLVFFVATTSNLAIPWDQIKNVEDLNSFIKTLVSKLYEKINPESSDNNYVKEVDLSRAHVGENIQNIYREQGEAAASEAYLKEVNGEKEKVFQKWWKLLTQDAQYTDEPAFAYCMLRAILDKSPATTNRPPSSLNEQAVKNIYEKIKASGGKESFKIIKNYQKEVVKENQNALVANPDYEVDPNDSNNGWLRIKSKKNDKENYEKNLQTLKDYSFPAGWCTGSSHADTYLPKGDLWLYLENGDATVTVRFEGNSVGEIRGINNTVAFNRWEEVVSLFDRHNFDKSSYDFQRLKDAAQVNNDFENNPEERNNILEKARSGDLTKIEQLGQINKATPEAKEAAEAGWLYKLKHNIKGAYDQNKPFRDIPNEYLDNPEIYQIVKEKWIEEAKSNYTGVGGINRAPQRKIQKDPEYGQAFKEGFLEKLDKGITETVLRSIPLSLERDKDVLERIKAQLLNDYERGVSIESIWGSQVPIMNTFRNDSEVVRVRAEAWTKYIRVNPLRFDPIGESAYGEKKIPEDLKKDPAILGYFRDGLLGRIRGWNSPHLDPYLQLANKYFPNDQEFYEVSKEKLIAELQTQYAIAQNATKPEISDMLKKDPDFDNILIGILAAILKRNPFKTFSSRITEINESYFPKRLQNNQTIMEAQKYGLKYFFKTRHPLNVDFSLMSQIIPKEVRSDREVINTYIDTLAALVSRNPIEYEDPKFPKGLKKHKKIIGALIEGKQAWIEKYENEIADGQITREQALYFVKVKTGIPEIMRTDIINWFSVGPSVEEKDNRIPQQPEQQPKQQPPEQPKQPEVPEENVEEEILAKTNWYKLHKNNKK